MKKSIRNLMIISGVILGAVVVKKTFGTKAKKEEKIEKKETDDNYSWDEVQKEKHYILLK